MQEKIAELDEKIEKAGSTAEDVGFKTMMSAASLGGAMAATGICLGFKSEAGIPLTATGFLLASGSLPLGYTAEAIHKGLASIANKVRVIKRNCLQRKLDQTEKTTV